MKKVICALLAALLLASCSSASNTPISYVYAFGGDFSDTGNWYKFAKEAVAQGQFPPSSLNGMVANWQGRLSNGPVALEILAERLKVGLTNYAVAAASSGYTHLEIGVNAFKNAGLLGQIDKFEAELKGKQADAGALYYLELSFIDFGTYITSNRGSTGTLAETIADLEIANLTTAITRLNKLGAKQFMVVSLDWSNWPGFTIGAPWVDARPIDQGFLDASKIFLARKNSTLPGAMEKLAGQLNIKINLFDYAAAEGRIRGNPGQYGFTELTRPCREMPYNVVGVCSSPDQYVFWGYYYLTARTHQVLGEAMAEQISKQ